MLLGVGATYEQRLRDARRLVEWAVAGVLGGRVQLDWIRQPASPGTWRAEFS
ncbi:DUF3145 family protein, partial [Streptomyces sp. NPDC003036]|uniref:DUF3145 family protein n=1 Tax=Streptomyces sp. NPDC003036 TaxID=3154442 RepID=UPI0033A8433F